jgi:hypothetical protein
VAFARFSCSGGELKIYSLNPAVYFNVPGISVEDSKCGDSLIDPDADEFAIVAAITSETPQASRAITSTAMSPTGNHFALGYLDGEVRLEDITILKEKEHVLRARACDQIILLGVNPDFPKEATDLFLAANFPIVGLCGGLKNWQENGLVGRFISADDVADGHHEY